MVETKRTQEEVDDVLDKCAEQTEQGTTKWSAMSYEQGVEAALRWVTGDTDDDPMEDE